MPKQSDLRRNLCTYSVLQLTIPDLLEGVTKHLFIYFKLDNDNIGNCLLPPGFILPLKSEVVYISRGIKEEKEMSRFTVINFPKLQNIFFFSVLITHINLIIRKIHLKISHRKLPEII